MSKVQNMSNNSVLKQTNKQNITKNKTKQKTPDLVAENFFRIKSTTFNFKEKGIIKILH